MIKYIKTVNLDITHEDQEVGGLQFVILCEERNIKDTFFYIKVTGEETDIEEWRLRVNGIEVTEQEVLSFLGVAKPVSFSIEVDKTLILADGIDAAKITVQYRGDEKSAYVVVNGRPVSEEEIADGLFEFKMVSTDPGIYKVDIVTGNESKFVIIKSIEE